MLPTDYVIKACVVGDKQCELKKKCIECIKELKALNEIDNMFKTMLDFHSGGIAVQ
jgi:hypothetical protein